MAGRDHLQNVLTTDPLPKRHLLETDGIGGRLKATPEDFIVEELPLYEPSGEGEHLYLRVRKTNMSHGEMMRRVAAHFGVSTRRIGFAGMKDKRAVTSQYVSVHTDREFDPNSTIDNRIDVLWAARHTNKLRRGHLAGNRFSISVREVDPLKAPVAARSLDSLVRLGAPNYFGDQRFGYRRNNHRLGTLLLKRRWREFLDELLGAAGSDFPEHQRSRREMFDQGQYGEALKQWSANDRAERLALQILVGGGDDRRACLNLGRHAISFYINAAQSAIFNRLLDDRLASGMFDRLQPGDLAWKHDSRSVFAVTPEDLEAGDLSDRLARVEVSPSGPLWGAGMTRAGGATDEGEQAALLATGVTLEDFEASPARVRGARRAMRVRVENSMVDGGVDERGGFIRMAFDLERGAYATIVLREVMQS